MRTIARFKRWIWTLTHIEAIIDHERAIIEHDYIRKAGDAGTII